MFDKLKKEGGEMMEERVQEQANSQEPIESELKESSSEIGIGELMGKRAKLEDAIDYVGIMIKNLKDKRTLLEKDVEDESVMHVQVRMFKMFSSPALSLSKGRPQVVNPTRRTKVRRVG